MRPTKLDGDVGGLAIGAMVVAVPVFLVLQSKASVGSALLAALVAGVGIALAGAVWVAAGSPPADRLLRDHPMLSCVILAVFVLGLVPAIVIGRG